MGRKRRRGAARRKARAARHTPTSPAWLLTLGLILIGLGALLARRTVAREPEPEAIPVAVDFDAPEVAVPSLTGDQVHLTDFRGQVVLVNLWATWCPPCRAEMPTLEAYYRDHAAQGFVVLAIESGGESPEEVAAFVQRYGLSFPVAWDPDGQAMTAFRTQVLPSSFVLDRTGRVRLAWSGPITRATLERVVTPLLESP